MAGSSLHQDLPRSQEDQTSPLFAYGTQRAVWAKNCIDRLAGPGENLPIPPITPILAKCRHPQVRVVARDEDTEFVECQKCGEVFDAIEYRDMMLEEEEQKRAAEETADSA